MTARLTLAVLLAVASPAAALCPVGWCGPGCQTIDCAPSAPTTPRPEPGGGSCTTGFCGPQCGPTKCLGTTTTTLRPSTTSTSSTSTTRTSTTSSTTTTVPLCELTGAQIADFVEQISELQRDCQREASCTCHCYEPAPLGP